MLFTRRPSVPLRSPSAPWLLLGAPRNVLATVLPNDSSKSRKKLWFGIGEMLSSSYEFFDRSVRRLTAQVVCLLLHRQSAISTFR